MNILSYIHVHRLPNPSGVGRVIDRLLSAHADRYPAARHRMLVEAGLYDEVYPHLPDQWKRASFIPHRHSTSWQQARWVWRGKPLAEEFWKEVDLVYCPAESYVPTRTAKLVCTIHDVAGFEPDLYPNDVGRRLHCLKWTQLFNCMARRADAVVTVSHFSAARIARFFPGLEGKLRVVYNAPHEVFGSKVGESTMLEVGHLSGGRPFVLVPGGLSLRKNGGLVLDALPLLQRELPEVKVLVAGSNEPPYVRQMEELDVDNVELCGYVSDDLLNALYQTASAVWFPSRYEGFGMPVIEAMASGAAVVASNAASIPEVAGDAALLCGMDDPTGHVEAIKSIVVSPRQRAERGRASHEHARRFTWAHSADELERIFQSL